MFVNSIYFKLHQRIAQVYKRELTLQGSVD